MITLEPAASLSEDLLSCAPYSCSPGWLKLCSDIYGYSLRLFTVRKDGAVTGAFACAVVPSALFGTRLISMPFSDETGLWFLPGRAPSEEDMAGLRGLLASGLDGLAAETGARYSELRGFPLEGGGFEVSEPYLRLLLDTSRPYGELRAGFHVNLIKNLRKADKTVLFSEQKGEGAFARVYGIYLRQMRSFGSPPLPAEHFEALLRDGQGRLFTASVGGRTAALLFAIVRNGTFYADINAGLPEFENFFPKIKLFDETIRLACGEGLARYDFMRTRRGSGVHAHKGKWGGREIPIRYVMRPHGKSAAASPDPDDARFAAPRAMLRLAPLPLLRALGPALRRHAGK